MAKCCFVLISLILTLGGAAVAADHPLLIRYPAVNQTQIVFEYAGDLWLVDRAGGDAHRLTTGVGRETGPCFSPDGTQIAFTGEYDGNVDVYVAPVSGGIPRRLTYHPSVDLAMGWTPDGKRVLFSSSRDNYADGSKLYTMALDGSFPESLPLPIADEGSYSPDGSHIAYSPVFQWQVAWKKYRGGQTKKIWLADLADSSIVKVPRENSNDFNPMWVGNKVYFLSDRNGPVSLFVYDTVSGKVSEALKSDGLDFKSASAGFGAIVIEQFGALHLYDLGSGKAHRVEVRLSGDLAEVRPRFEKLTAGQIENFALSPSGLRAVFESHGEIITVPAEKGDVRNLTRSPAVADRDPAWSPDGKWIAYFSDESGEYALHLRDQSGLGVVRKISLGTAPSYFYTPVWSPDSKKIAYTDKRLNLWYVDVDKGSPVKVDTDRFDSPAHRVDPKWSPDSRWITYTKQLANSLHAVFVYSVPDAKSNQLTDGLSDAFSPDFDKNGKYIYFIASTNVALSAGWIDMTSIARPVTASVYVLVLRKDLPSPLAPESDDEKSPDAKPDASADAKKAETPKDASNNDKTASKDKPAEPAKPPADVLIDFDRISQRVLDLPIPPKNYQGLATGKEGVVFLFEGPPVDLGEGPPVLTIQKFDLKTRKTEKFFEGVLAVAISAKGEKLLVRQGEQWLIIGADSVPKPGEGVLKLAEMEVYVDPRQEWKQMYHEVWRIERDFFYDPGFHGLNLAAAEKFYAPYLDGVASREDLNYLFSEMLGNISVGHMFIGGGIHPEVKRLNVGLLGADYSLENGRYRFARVFDGENWNPGLRAPLTQPGVNVAQGDFLLAVRGTELHSTDNIYSFFQETADKQIVIKVGPNPDGTGSREVTVVPVGNETGLRHLAWVEGNRRKVDQLSHGTVAYVHLPDTAGGGFTSFNRYFFAQVGRQGAVLDERFNHGGEIADYIIEYLSRKPMARLTSREGEDVTDPIQAIYGPKVMIINQFAGSGGDAMPWYFRKAGLGPLVGVRTWGGLVGIGNYPPLIDGGRVTAPRWAFYGLKGEWEVEGHGIAPDIEVDQDPKLVRQGHDPQLERSVEVVLEEIKKQGSPTYIKPAYPDFHQTFPTSQQ